MFNINLKGRFLIVSQTDFQTVYLFITIDLEFNVALCFNIMLEV